MKLRRRATHSDPRPVFTREDALFLLQLPLLCFAAWFLPMRSWPQVARGLERAKIAIGVFSTDAVVGAAMKAMPGLTTEGARRLAVHQAARRTQHHLEILRAYRPGGWRPPIVMTDRQHLDGALAAGRGAVLWVAHFSSSALAGKMALSAAGFRVWHVSRPEHGFSKSRFGIRWLNPIRIHAERRYLAGRIEIDRDRPGKAMLAARRALAEGGIVSITAGAWEGGRLASVLLFGGAIELAVGAPRLALLTGSALLPVFVLHDKAGRCLSVRIGRELMALPGAAGETALLQLTQAFVDATAPFIRECPDQWRDWKNLRFSQVP